MSEPQSPAAAPTPFEDYPLTRIEYITALTHFYRGERGRADAWRVRLDPTTNWAVVTTGGMLSFAFSRRWRCGCATSTSGSSRSS
jgi:uncharacterized membrane protein